MAYYEQFLPDLTTDQPFICNWRSLAFEFAKKIQPGHDSRLTFDALMLGATCNMTRPTEAPTRRVIAKSDCDIFVAVDGDDSHAGTSTITALKTPAAGVLAMRRVQKKEKVLCIGAGTFFLKKQLELGSADSGLTIRGSAGETWISGALELPRLKWDLYKTAPATPGKLQVLQNTDNQAGCTPDDPSTASSGGCGCYNLSATAGECQALCEKLGPESCPSFAWSGKSNDKWSEQCCIRADGAWIPKPLAAHVSGSWSQPTGAIHIWKASLKGIKLPDTPHLRVNGARSPRARFPNANPETDQWPIGWIPDAKTWLPAKKPKSKPQFVGVVNQLIQTRNDELSVNKSKPYSGGIGGPCEVFSPPFSYWCSAHPAGGGGFQYYVPSGMTVPAGTFPKDSAPTNWHSKGKGATVQAFRRSHWASWMFDVSSVGSDGADHEIGFGRGGYQGCRGGPGQDWYVENVLELLDAPNEHYIDTDTATLYYQANSTSGPPQPDLEFEIPVLQTLLAANASQHEPITGLTISGVGFRDTSPSYMEPHGVPSGGDWALERMGALFLEGTVDLSIDGCNFERLDGNAVMLSGFHRGAGIVNSHFAWTGGTAIAAWGRTDELTDGGVHGWDATAGDIPQGTRIIGNIMRESGIWEKQSSCFFQAKTAGSTLLRNLCFNLPRAGFNFNDGLGGGDEVHENLIFNSNRETSDHGPINSWDRQPFVSTFGAAGLGVATAHMLPRNISQNFLVANYGGTNGAIDNDDESLRFNNNHNFQIYGHQKFKTGAIRSFGNVIAYASGFGEKWPSPGTFEDEPNVMFDNRVWFMKGALYHGEQGWTGNRSHDNHLVGLDLTLSGGESLADWQKKNPSLNDVGTTYESKDIATQHVEIMAAAREVLASVLE